MKNNKLDNFESFINDKISGDQVAYNPQDWNDLSARLDAASPTPFYKKGWFLGGAAAIVVGASSLLINPKEENLIADTPIVIQEETKPEKLSENVQLENDFIAKKEVIKTSELNHKKLKETNKNTKSETKTKEEESVETLTNHQPPQEKSTLPSSLTQSNNKVKTENENLVISKPVAEYTYLGTLKGCQGLEVTFKAQEQKNVNYLWSFGDGVYSDLINPTHIYPKSGTYQVELIVQSAIDKSILTKSEYNEQVTIFENPKMEIIEDQYLEKGITTIDYSFVGDKVNKLKWNLGDENEANTSEVQHQYKKSGRYQVELEAYSVEGCKSKVSKTVFVDHDYNLLAPTAFSPNGDGLNDTFLPEALKQTQNQFTMIVQSRTNGIVFETSSASNQWDGKNYKTGRLCDETSYVWVVKLTNQKGEIEEYKGVVLVTMTDR